MKQFSQNLDIPFKALSMTLAFLVSACGSDGDSTTNANFSGNDSESNMKWELTSVDSEQVKPEDAALLSIHSTSHMQTGPVADCSGAIHAALAAPTKLKIFNLPSSCLVHFPAEVELRRSQVIAALLSGAEFTIQDSVLTLTTSKGKLIFGPAH